MYSVFIPSESLHWAPIDYECLIFLKPDSAETKLSIHPSWRLELSFQLFSELPAFSKGHQMQRFGANHWYQRSYPELKATWVGAIDYPGSREVGKFAKHWRTLTCLLLMRWSLVPAWSSGAAIFCQELVCSCGARQLGWCPPTTFHMDSGRWPSCSCKQPLRTNLQSTFCMSKPSTLWINRLPVFS